MTSLIFIVYSLHLTCTEIAMYLSVSINIDDTYLHIAITPSYIHTYIHIHSYCNCCILLYIINHPYLHSNLTSLPAQQSHIPTCTAITHPYTYIHSYIHTYTYILQLLSQSCYISSIIPTCTAISHPYLHTNLTSLLASNIQTY